MMSLLRNDDVTCLTTFTTIMGDHAVVCFLFFPQVRWNSFTWVKAAKNVSGVRKTVNKLSNQMPFPQRVIWLLCETGQKEIHNITSKSIFTDRSKAVLLLWIVVQVLLHVGVCCAIVSVSCSLVVTCWERADLLAVLFCCSCHFPKCLLAHLRIKGEVGAVRLV